MRKLASIAVSLGIIIVIVGLVLVGIYGRDKITSGDWFSYGSAELGAANDGQDLMPNEFEGLQEIKVNVSAYSVYVLENDIDVLSVRYITPLEDDVEINVSSIEDGVLTITQTDSLSRVHWGFNWLGNRRFIAIYVPKTEQFANVKLTVTANYSSVNISDTNFVAVDVATDAGSVKIDDVTAGGMLMVSTSAGSIKLHEINASNIQLSSNAGSITASEVDCTNFKASADAGSIKAIDIDATTSAEIKVSAGSVKCDIDTAKLVIDSSAGSIKFETNADTIELSSGAGSIAGTVNGNKSEYSINVKHDMGSSNISNQNVDGAKYLKVESDMGSIKIKFDN